VTDDLCGHTLPDLALGARIHQQGRIRVGMWVNKTRSHIKPLCLDGSLRFLLDTLCHHGDTAISHSHVGPESRFPRAVHHHAILDQNVQHRFTPFRHSSFVIRLITCVTPKLAMAVATAA
jgi:hypothetical protein